MSVKRLSCFALLLALIMLISTAVVAESYTHVLKQGMRDDTDELDWPDGEDDIRYMQQRLSNYAYYTGALDGIYGKKMTAAVKEFQKRNGLKADGRIGQNTWIKLVNTDSVGKYDKAVDVSSVSVSVNKMRQGDKGETVLELQKLLQNKWHFLKSGAATSGVFDAETAKAVKAFQTAVGLTADGVVGANTWSALNDSESKYFSVSILVRRKLSKGMRGYDVNIVQKRLNLVGYPVSEGWYFDDATAEALANFQTDYMIASSGVLDANTRNALWGHGYTQTLPMAPESTPITVTRPTLKSGSTGQYVRSAQGYLKNGSYYSGPIDGKFGAQTKAAVIAFQNAVGLPATGIIDDATWEKLILLPAPSAAALTPKGVLKRGSKGSTVTELQNLLVHVGLLDSTDVDGKFGPKTEAAVKKYQQLRNLKVDGKVGPNTLASLKAEP